MSSDAFVIDLPVARATIGGTTVERVSSLVEAIKERAIELLKDNLPEWSVVEAALVLAYNTYVRPLSLPNFLDNLVLAALLREVKKFYDTL